MGKQTAIDSLKAGDYIAFEWAHGIFGKEIIVDNITSVNKDDVLVHFLYGYKSEAEYIKKEDIIAIGDNSATGKGLVFFNVLCRLFVSD